MAVITGMRRSSSNEKTGAMAQVWILRSDRDPVNAARNGEDEAICGDCPLRPVNAEPGAARCYVNKGFGPNAVYRSFALGRYPSESPADVGRELVDTGRPVRLGAYGDPAAVPVEVWRELLQPGVKWTGYTHQWRKDRVLPYRDIVMASADSAKDRRDAMRQGWRTFRVRSANDPLRTGEISCPASAESGHRTTCEQCGLCNGRRRGDRRKTIAIIDHGPTAARKDH